MFNELYQKVVTAFNLLSPQMQVIVAVVGCVVGLIVVVKLVAAFFWYFVFAGLAAVAVFLFHRYNL